MLFLKYVLMTCGLGMITIAVAILSYDLYLQMQYRRLLPTAQIAPPVPRIRWRSAVALGLLAWGPIVLALGIVVVPSGMAGIRVSQTSGTLAGTLYPGVHLVVPVVERVQLFDTRDELFTTGAVEGAKESKREPLKVQSKEGLDIGLAITVRY